MAERYFVMWWVPAGHRPTMQEAIERLEHLNAQRRERVRLRLGKSASAQLYKTARCA